MAGGILLLGAMTFVMPFQTVVPIHGLVQLTSNFSRSWILRKSIHRKIFYHFLLGSPLGGFAGYLLLSRVTKPEWFLSLVILLLVYVVFKPKKLPYLKINLFGFTLLGLLAACLGCLIGATGPILAPFFIREDLTKEQIVATKAACQIVVHLIKLPIFFALSFAYDEYVWLILLMVITVIIGTRLGTFLLQRIDGKQFMRYVKIAMLIMAVRLIYVLSVSMGWQ